MLRDGLALLLGANSASTAPFADDWPWAANCMDLAIASLRAWLLFTISRNLSAELSGGAVVLVEFAKLG
jgi:hypothetical protein